MLHVVFEPHPDDVFLSMGWTLQSRIALDKMRVEIVTVFNNEKRGKEAQEYAKRIGASSTLMGLEESKMNSEFNLANYFSVLNVTIKQAIKLYEEKEARNVTYYIPLGLQHPDHRALRHIENLTAPHRTLLYVDTPYQTKRKNKIALEEGTISKRIRSLVFPPKKKWDLIPVFKSQSMFFHYNKYLIDSKIPEIVLTR